VGKRRSQLARFALAAFGAPRVRLFGGSASRSIVDTVDSVENSRSDAVYLANPPLGMKFYKTLATLPVQVQYSLCEVVEELGWARTAR